MLVNISRRLGIVFVVLVVCSSSTGHDVPPTGKATLAPMLENVTPAVVNISATKLPQYRSNTQFWGRFPSSNRPRKSAGSGLIVNAENGYVVTNHHVIDQAEDIVVTLLDRREFEASVLGSDPDTDLAVLKIEPDDLQDLELGNSDDLRVGDFVVAIGNPFGFGQSVTSGIVSALGRTGLGIEKYEDFIQTDASINPGNSGGPLVDLEGNVVGINTAIIGSSGSIGIGFAIPSSMVASVLGQLIEHGQVSRGVIGIRGKSVSREIADIYELESMKGAILTDVAEGSSADRAGLQIRDVIVAIDDKEVEDWDSLRAQIGLKRVGEVIEVEFVRDGAIRSVKASIVDSSEAFGIDPIPGLNGVALDDISSSHDSYRHVQGKGVVIEEINTSSNAYNLGLRKNDVITHINRYSIESLEQLLVLVDELEEITGIRVYRKGRTYTLML